MRVRGRRRPSVENSANVARREPPEAAVEEQGIVDPEAVARWWRWSSQEAGPADREPPMQGVDGRRAQRDLTLLGPLPPHRDPRPRQIEVGDTESADLAHP